eukprot:2712679-Rhodomonas_salina.1
MRAGLDKCGLGASGGSNAAVMRQPACAGVELALCGLCLRTCPENVGPMDSSCCGSSMNGMSTDTNATSSVQVALGVLSTFIEYIAPSASAST